MGKINLKISLFLAALCFIAGFFAVPYQLQMLQDLMPEKYEDMLATMPLPMVGLQIIASLQLFIVSFVLSLIGIKLARKTGFSLNILDSIVSKAKIKVNKKSIILSIISGIGLGFVLMSYDRFYFQYQNPMIAEHHPEFSFIALIAGVFYGGVFEEILLRLFLMSLTVWLFMKIFKLTKESVSSKYYWIAIVFTSLMFAIGHFPATQMAFGELTTDLIIRGLFLNSIGGLVFGYLYWKKGLEFAILAHMFTHISMQLFFIPIFY
ncbi:membrane protease YdiL (CAAX protease family) [Bacillus ectoiniformans]|uniref:CPBP family intramembrane glutamic endopeptidase n=1 Tax=Bacillus ectoiniformans TaxID=1494429 RepID=UPI00195B4119|nr:CPBP family intramembrane glutamic endopeptidase [Bacillus ectoiniformans]MBM7648209.1 membrane protease YdiL (CAAX protease family) [Bacillus ectoiniformans]